ncbi:TPM domain-containing protein [Synechocystis salina]|uniref:TPM domain-containing protein n=1 Tax=Synechocystis salina LEGE 00031 TaxID=1828736 RepID=A0ABR9VNK7_9SYNC|nr:TPM domain-containing protein [Synechocystis salina]MBE9239793.1 TPM domain-containing protein [Synechocystis salina LEGE 00041]MBE9252927.1 TPM domain-containing protein [Synechocystis salina LEGE 00031]
MAVHLPSSATRFSKNFAWLLAVSLSLVLWWAPVSPAQAVNNPELLPEEKTPVVDLANFLPEIQEAQLIDDLNSFEVETGWKLRVLTQYDRSPGRAVIPFWGLDDKSILLVADGRGGNLLAFSIGDEVYELMPRTFWIEMQARFGNMYYIRDNGENLAITEALNTVKGCLVKGGCNVVPGLPREQWILTLVTSIVGGLIFGFAAIPRSPNQTFAWQWVLIMSPLWGILVIAFGIGPVVTRTSDFLPLFRNLMGFSLGVLVAYLSPMFSQINNNPQT